MAKESVSQQSEWVQGPGGEESERSDDSIERIETYCIELPYRNAVQFRSVREASGAYILLRLVTRSGAEGIAESVARPAHSGEDPKLLAYAIRTFFAPLLEGADPFAHNDILARIAKVKGARTVHSLIDVALWDLRGKLLGQPVWRLLGGGKPARVPVGWIAHGNTAEAMTQQAVEAIEVRGFSALKIKTWKRSREDVTMIRDIRAAVGEDVVMWADSNGAYTETEARTILPELAPYGIAFLEEPCTFTDPLRMAAVAADLPIALLGDQTCGTVGAVYHLIKINAVGAVSVKLRRTGISDSLKNIALADAAGLPVVIGTDSESRIGSLVRIHLRAAIPSLAPWPTETHFFEKLGDDTFVGDFDFHDGGILPTDAPGFGAAIDWEKVEKYSY
ncbi:MAG: hypothetical protein OXF11_10900 [Deltaproteobacteria bacterium]|nr:hypothetical protein [Deltaproteobacteria bacterium]